MDDHDLTRVAATMRDQRAAATRLRVAHMYFVENLTQNEIAERLGVGRVTVVRHLNDARAAGEVKFWIEGELADCAALELRLEHALGLDRAIVAPAAARPEHTAQLIGFNAGIHLSEALADGMRVGVGWGRTMAHALATLSRRGLRDVQVVSLLGGIYHARLQNPSEFAWRVAAAIGADCHLFTAPAIVDAPETKAALLERCGLARVVARADNLDLAIFGVGAVDEDGTAVSYVRDMVGADLTEELRAAGAVGDLLFHYFDARGEMVAHGVNDRVMSVPLACVRRARRKVLVAGGPSKTRAIIAACRMLGVTTLVTDEGAADAVLRRIAADSMRQSD